MSAEYIAEKVGDGATVAVFPVPSSGSFSELRMKGFYAYPDEINFDKSNILEVSDPLRSSQKKT